MRKLQTPGRIIAGFKHSTPDAVREWTLFNGVLTPASKLASQERTHPVRNEPIRALTAIGVLYLKLAKITILDSGM